MTRKRRRRLVMLVCTVSTVAMLVGLSLLYAMDARRGGAAAILSVAVLIFALYVWRRGDAAGRGR